MASKKKSVAPKPQILPLSSDDKRARERFVEDGKPTRKRQKKTAKLSKVKKSQSPRGTERTGRPPLEEERVQMTTYLPQYLRDKLRERSLTESIAKGRRVPETDIVIEALIAYL